MQIKVAVDRPWHRSFLGFYYEKHPAFQRVSPTNLCSVQTPCPGIDREIQGSRLERMIGELIPYLRDGLVFGFSQGGGGVAILDSWIRRTLRCVAGFSGRPVVALSRTPRLNVRNGGQRGRLLARRDLAFELLASAAQGSPKAASVVSVCRYGKADGRLIRRTAMVRTVCLWL